MLVRIVYRPDGTVGIISAAKHVKDIQAAFDKANVENYPYDDVDSSEITLPEKDRNYWRGSKETGLYVDEDQKAKDMEAIETEALITNKMRTSAIESLKGEGKLAVSFKDTKE